MDTSNPFLIATIVIVVLIVIIVFFLMREVMCWYYKINQRVKLQKMQIEALYRIVEKLGGEVNWGNVYKELGDKNPKKE